jgi:hypothetical protein
MRTVISNSAVWFVVLFVAIGGGARAEEPAGETQAITPTTVSPLFTGKDLTGLTTWLKDTKRDDPRGVFTVVDGMIHLSGDGLGELCTKQQYRDYRLVVEYKWGRRTDGRNGVRNSGILLHAIGPDDASEGIWPSSIECQIAQGCVGDFIPIRGKDTAGKEFPVRLTAETEAAPGGRRHRWKPGGDVKSFPPVRSQLWWNKHQWDFEEILDTHGKDDVESPLDEWTRVECICDGDRITVKVNGHTVNECYDVHPSAGRIGLEVEGFEIDFRRFELHPLERDTGRK